MDATYSDGMKNVLSFVWWSIVLAAAWGCTSETDVNRTVHQPQSPPPEASAFLSEAQDAFRQGAFHSALTLVDSASQYAPGLADVYAARGHILAELMRLDDAQAAFEKTLSLDRTYQGSQFNLGSIAFRQGRFRDALAHYRSEQELYPSARVLVQIGWTHLRMSEQDSARRAFQDAIALDASYADAYSELALLYEKQGALEKALHEARRALKLEPDSPDYHFVVGNLLLHTGEFQDAARHLQATIKQLPWHHAAHYSLGQALARLERKDESAVQLAIADSLWEVQMEMERLQGLAEANPRRPQHWAHLGNMLYRYERVDEAIEAFKVAFSLDPSNLALQNNIANLNAMYGDTAEAIRWYRAVLKQDSTAAGVWFNLGVTYAEAGDTAGARRAWQNAIRYDPDSPAQDYLAEP